MQILYDDCLKYILSFCSQKDLIIFRLISKKFKILIDSLSLPEVNIYTACEKGYFLNLRYLINGFYNYNYALEKAFKGKNYNIVKYIMNKYPISYSRALLLSVIYGNLEIIKYIMKQHISFPINILLFNSCQNENIEVVDYFLNIEPNYNVALSGICKFKNYKLLNHILTYAENIDDDNLFQIGCEFGNIEFIKNALNKGLNANLNKNIEIACKSTNEIILFLFNEEKLETWMYNLCQSGNFVMFKYFYEKYSCHHLNHNILLIDSAKSGNLNFLKYIYDKHLHNDSLDTVAYMASKYGYLDIVKFLIDCGINNIDTIFEEACYSGNIELIKFLISLGIKNLNNALIRASYAKNKDIIKFLISHGANNLNDALTIICRQYDVLDLVDYLIKNGADDLNSCFILAHHAKNYDILEYLIKNYKDKISVLDYYITCEIINKIISQV